MATWKEMSIECLSAAKSLLNEGYLRRSVTNSYYAAYCAATGMLVERGVAFAHGLNNPAPEQLPDLVLDNTPLPRNERHEINNALRRLRATREDADYRPRFHFDRGRALISIHDSLDVLSALEILE